MKKSKTNKGISIIESLVCIVIVGIGFVAMLQVSAYSISSMDRAIENNKVNFLTEMMAEDMIADPDQINQYASFDEKCNYPTLPTVCASGSSGAVGGTRPSKRSRAATHRVDPPLLHALRLRGRCDA